MAKNLYVGTEDFDEFGEDAQQLKAIANSLVVFTEETSLSKNQIADAIEKFRDLLDNLADDIDDLDDEDEDTGPDEPEDDEDDDDEKPKDKPKEDDDDWGNIQRSNT